MMSTSVVLGEDQEDNQPFYWPKQLADCHNITLLKRMNFDDWENEHYGHLRQVMPKYQLCLLATKRGCKDTIPEPLDVAIMLVIFLVLAACLLYFAFFKREVRPKMGIMSFFTERNECSRSVRTMQSPNDDGSITGPLINHSMPSSK
ncbi:uncharacterized protein LOC131889142 [Tigriopus californicus]|uniref:uncharacterized protein LOC131889142 n=1 Tax=Tigriopus californicus TaxID=6832 RepID=UPI0027D9E77D|nr:uncharacterized protein LOC131889142 [Tigriopus californicus]